jgi:hypothetical protein
MNIDINSMARASIPAVVVLVMMVSAKLLTARKTNPAFHKVSSQALRDRFLPLKGRIFGGWFAVAVAFFFASWLAGYGINRLLAGLDGPAIFRLFPEPAMWWVFPFIGTLCLSWEVTLQIWTRFAGRDTVDLFVEWSNTDSAFWARSKFEAVDYRRVLRWMALLGAGPFGVGVLLGVNMHASVGPDRIRDCRYAFQPCRIYMLNDTVRITEIAGVRDKSGKLIDRAGVVLDFKDGHRWSSAKWGDWRQFADPALEKYLIGRTGLPLHFALTEKEIPQLAGRSAPN